MNITEKLTEALICESCGKVFPCGAKTGNCWCFDLKISTAALSEIGQNFCKCLCPECLTTMGKRFSENSKSDL